MQFVVKIDENCCVETDLSFKYLEALNRLQTNVGW